jgi:hypothetical protein
LKSREEEKEEEEEEEEEDQIPRGSDPGPDQVPAVEARRIYLHSMIPRRKSVLERDPESLL